VIAAIGANALISTNGRVMPNAKKSLERLRHYGYTIEVEVDRAVDMTAAQDFMERHDLLYDCVALRGDSIPALIIDRRHGSFRSWNTHMNDVDETHRKKYQEWVRQEDAEKAPVTCLIPQSNEDPHPLEECVT